MYSLHRLVGGLGVGPKYLVDEYAVLDARYWVLGDSLVAWVCYQEFFIMMPLELVWYIALQRRHWSRHYWAVVTGEFTGLQVGLLGCRWVYWAVVVRGESKEGSH